MQLLPAAIISPTPKTDATPTWRKRDSGCSVICKPSSSACPRSRRRQRAKFSSPYRAKTWPFSALLRPVGPRLSPLHPGLLAKRRIRCTSNAEGFAPPDQGTNHEARIADTVSKVIHKRRRKASNEPSPSSAPLVNNFAANAAEVVKNLSLAKIGSGRKAPRPARSLSLRSALRDSRGSPLKKGRKYSRNLRDTTLVASSPPIPSRPNPKTLHNPLGYNKLPNCGHSSCAPIPHAN